MNAEITNKKIEQLEIELRSYYQRLLNGKIEDFSLFEKKIVTLFEEMNKANPDLILGIHSKTHEIYELINKIAEHISKEQLSNINRMRELDQQKKANISYAKCNINIANNS